MIDSFFNEPPESNRNHFTSETLRCRTSYQDPSSSVSNSSRGTMDLPKKAPLIESHSYWLEMSSPKNSLGQQEKYTPKSSFGHQEKYTPTSTPCEKEREPIFSTDFEEEKVRCRIDNGSNMTRLEFNNKASGRRMKNIARNASQRHILLGAIAFVSLCQLFSGNLTRRRLFAHTAAVEDTFVDCGCPSTCTELALNQHANGRSTCKELILTEMSKWYGKNAERIACNAISREYPLICGSHCDPNHCSLTAQDATPKSDGTDSKTETKPVGPSQQTDISPRNKEEQPRTTPQKTPEKKNLPKAIVVRQPSAEIKPLRPAMIKKYRELVLLRNITEPVRKTDVPFYLHVFKSAGSTMKAVLGQCYGLSKPHQTKEPPSLEVVARKKGRGGLVNVHTLTPETIALAKEMGLVESKAADVIVSSFPYEGAQLFNPKQRGRMFAIFRHPVERAVSLFYYLCHATWENTYDPSLCNYTLKEYGERVAAGKPLGGDNWLVRRLSNKKRGPVNDEDLALAIEVLQTKFLVGLMNEMTESVKRFETFFGWKNSNKECLQQYLHDKPANQFSHESAVEGSEEFELLASQYKYDLILYKAAEEAFREQAKLFK